MTSTSFHPSQPGYRELFLSNRDGDPSVSRDDITTSEPLAPEDVHAVETRRMRDFAGQRKFRAPVEADFSSGMLATGQVQGEDAKPLKYFRLINSLTSWWRR